MKCNSYFDRKLFKTHSKALTLLVFMLTALSVHYLCRPGFANVLEMLVFEPNKQKRLKYFKLS